MESLEASWPASSSSESKGPQESTIISTTAESEKIDVGNRKGADILLHIHEQLDLERLQKVIR